MISDNSMDRIIAGKGNLQRVIDNLQEGIIAHDLNRRIFVFNRMAEQLTGYSRDEVIGRDCHEIFNHPLCGENCSFCGEHTFGTDRKEYQAKILAKDGGAVRVEMSVTAMNDEEGRLFGVLASIKDVTELIDLKRRAGNIDRFGNIVGHDNKMLQIFQQIQDVAAYDYPVHIFGETGTGKELVAAAIHTESGIADGPFVPINCGALPEGLVESELFGHVKGAFSGAVREKKGRFELASGGTIFLDEVAELSKYMQVKLLRVLQEGRFEKVGGERSIEVKVRVISATNRDLKEEVRKGNFRDDLYYRLNVIPLRLPPLRERKNDIPLLVEHFLREAGKSSGSAPVKVSRKAMALLMDYRWPGNVRELQNAVQFAIVRCSGKEAGPEDLPLEIVEAAAPLQKRGPARKLDIAGVKAALAETGGNKARAARNLGVGRATLYRFLSENADLM